MLFHGDIQPEAKKIYLFIFNHPSYHLHSLVLKDSLQIVTNSDSQNLLYFKYFKFYFQIAHPMY